MTAEIPAELVPAIDAMHELAVRHAQNVGGYADIIRYFDGYVIVASSCGEGRPYLEIYRACDVQRAYDEAQEEFQENPDDYDDLEDAFMHTEMPEVYELEETTQENDR